MTINAINSPRVTQLVRILAPFAMGYFLSYLLRVANAVLGPGLALELQLDASDLGLLTSVYFLTFAAMQIPVGMMLDGWGPRKTEASLLLLAAIGTLVFAMSDSMAGLVMGRALIGIGVSACLMGAFKAFVIWFPKERLPLVNGIQMAAGGMGALAGTAPLEWALNWTDWRGIFFALTIFSLAAAAAVFLLVPEREDKQPSSGINERLRGVVGVFASPFFWRLAPIAVTSQAAFLAIQSLWAGPWLRDIASMQRAELASNLSYMAMAMVAGFLLIGSLAERLGKLGISPLKVAIPGLSLFMLVQLVIAMNWVDLPSILWIIFGFCGTTSILFYAVLSQTFPPHLAGRVNTSLNLMVFIAAFVSQWGIGIIIDLWPTDSTGGYHPQGYQVAFLIVLALQVISLIWYFWSARYNPKSPPDQASPRAG